MFGLVKSYDVGFSVLYYLNPMVLTTIIIGIVSSTPIAKKLQNTFASKRETGEKVGYTLSMVYTVGILLLSMI
jgi:alginate O-acetyltransferase complex protein AlgI